MAEKKSPKFSAVYEKLLTRIQNGDFLPGAQLPTETELADRFYVSRNTLRQALMLLAQDGYISNQQGRGTFVLQNIPEDLNSFEKQTNPMIHCAKEKIAKPETSYEIVGINSNFKEIFNLDSSKLLIKLTNLYYTESNSENLVGISVSYIPYDLFSKSMVPLDNMDAVYDFYSYILSRRDIKGVSTVSFVDEDENTQKLFNDEQAESVIEIDETYKDKQGYVRMTQKLYMKNGNYVIRFYKPFR